jgi:anaerobic magnesium-protoporphyrin IX monomethyl ester cyclase
VLVGSVPLDSHVYRAVPGRIVHTRESAMIVQGMKQLYEDLGVELLLFQDDDFPLWGKAGPGWAYAIVDQVRHEELLGKVIWKISCRAESAWLDASKAT